MKMNPKLKFERIKIWIMNDQDFSINDLKEILSILSDNESLKSRLYSMNLKSTNVSQQWEYQEVEDLFEKFQFSVEYVQLI